MARAQDPDFEDRAGAIGVEPFGQDFSLVVMFLMRLLAGVKYPMCSKATSTGMGSGRTRSWGVDR